jgi:hypothetical protein
MCVAGCSCRNFQIVAQLSPPSVGNWPSFWYLYVMGSIALQGALSRLSCPPLVVEAMHGAA